MTNKILLSIIENLNDELIEVYRKLHENPELSMRNIKLHN